MYYHHKKCLSHDFVMHISVLHAATEDFIATESSNKIKLAWRKNTWKSGILYNRWWSLRDNKKAWKRPATVTGQGGPILFMRQDTLKHTHVEDNFPDLINVISDRSREIKSNINYVCKNSHK